MDAATSSSVIFWPFRILTTVEKCSRENGIVFDDRNVGSVVFVFVFVVVAGGGGLETDEPRKHRVRKLREDLRR